MIVTVGGGYAENTSPVKAYVMRVFFPPVNDPSSRASCSRDFIRARRSTYTISDVVVEYAGSFLCCLLHLGKSHELSPEKLDIFVAHGKPSLSDLEV